MRRRAKYDLKMMRGKYRLRTWLRGVMPAPLAFRIPKGRDDCGNHEWYRADDEVWRCYHCEPGVAHVSPFAPEEEIAGRMRALTHMMVALQRREPSSEVASEYHDLVAELSSLLRTGEIETRIVGAKDRHGVVV